MNCADGHLYACCKGEDISSTKCGFTTSDKPFEYCRKEYGRVFVPLTILTVYRVPRAAFGEKLLFVALEPFRVDHRHEVFNLTRSQLILGFEAVKTTFDALRATNPSLAEMSNVQEQVRPSVVSVTQIRKQEIERRKQMRAEKLQEEALAAEEQARKLEEHIERFLVESCE